MPIRVRRMGVAIAVSVLLVAIVGAELVLALWKDYLAVRVVAGGLYSLIGGVIGYVVGRRRAAGSVDSIEPDA